MTPEFRVWDKQDKKLRPVAIMNFSQWFLAAGELCEMSVSGFEASDRHNFEDNSDKCNRFVLEQYIGLKDKNGNKIFEGDILKVSDGESFYVAPVRYHSDDNYPAFDIDIRYVPSDWNYDDNIFSEILNYGNEVMTVIGNIRENPELLEAENE